MGRHWLALALALVGCTGFQATTTTPPRPPQLAPQSTATVITPRQNLPFSLPPPLTAPVVALCARRACDGTRLSATVDDTGTRATPDSDLAPGLWYWRVRAGSTVSAVWQLNVQITGGPETAWGGQLDLDGDGFAELAIGAPEANVGTNLGVGRVYVYAGGADGPDPLRPIVLDGPPGGSQFGQSLAAVDFDGDGFADLAVGAPTSGLAGAPTQGAIYVFRGGPGGIQSPAAFVLQDLNLAGAAQGLGWSLDCAGDLNGDGYGDLVTGAPTTTSDQGNLSGAAYVFFGGPSGGEQIAPLMPESNNHESIGWSVAGGGDLDGDGLADVLVGAPAAETSAGRAFVYFGSVSGTEGTPQILDVSPPPLAQFGSAIVQLGDVDGDGRADFAIGSPADGPGRVYRFTGGSVPPVAAVVVGPDLEGSSFGASLAAADLDGDGRDDLVVGAVCAPGDDASCPGAVYLLVGGALTGIVAPAGVVSYGGALSTGDLDGDGHADLIVGASEANDELGRVDWYRNAAPSPAPRVFNGSDQGGRFGFSVR